MIRGGVAYHVVIEGIDILQQARRAPPAPQHHQSLLFWVKRQLRAGMLLLLGNIIEGSCSTSLLRQNREMREDAFE